MFAGMRSILYEVTICLGVRLLEYVYCFAVVFCLLCRCFIYLCCLVDVSDYKKSYLQKRDEAERKGKERSEGR